MFWFRFILPVLSAAITFASFELGLRFVNIVGWISIIHLLFVLFFVWFLTRPATDFRERWNFLAIIGGFIISGWMVFFFLPQSFLVHILAIVGALLVFLFSYASFYYYYVPNKYQPFALDNASTYIAILSIFFFMSAFSGTIIFLSQPLWIIGGVIFLMGALYAYLVFWANKVWERNRWYYIAIVSLLITELFLAQSMWPISLFIRGASVAVFFYFLTGVIRAKVLGRLGMPALVRYSVIALAVFASIVVSARWN